MPTSFYHLIFIQPNLIVSKLACSRYSWGKYIVFTFIAYNQMTRLLYVIVEQTKGLNVSVFLYTDLIPFVASWNLDVNIREYIIIATYPIVFIIPKMIFFLYLRKI